MSVGRKALLRSFLSARRRWILPSVFFALSAGIAQAQEEVFSTQVPGPHAMAVSPGGAYGQFLYVAGGTQVWRVAPDGTATVFATRREGNGSISELFFDTTPDHRFGGNLFMVLDYFGGPCLAGIDRVLPDGAVQPFVNGCTSGPVLLGSIGGLVDDLGRFGYAMFLSDFEVDEFGRSPSTIIRVQPDASIAPFDGVWLRGVNGIALDRYGAFGGAILATNPLYTFDPWWAGADNGVYRIGPSGAWSRIVADQGMGTPTDIIVDSQGSFAGHALVVYAQASTIAEFDASGSCVSLFRASGIDSIEQDRWGTFGGDVFYSRPGTNEIIRMHRNAVFPNKGGNSGQITITIRSTNLDPASQVKLAASGLPDIVSLTVLGSHNGTALIATFDLSGQPVGVRDVVILNPDGTTRSFPSSFEIIAGGSSHLAAEVIGPTSFRYGAGESVHTFSLVYGNSGDIDAGPTGVSLSYPGFMSLTLLNPPGQVTPGVTDEGDPSLTAYLHAVPAGQTAVIPIRVALPDPTVIYPHQRFDIITWIDEYPAAQQPPFFSPLDQGDPCAETGLITCEVPTANGLTCLPMTPAECQERRILSLVGVTVNNCPCPSICANNKCAPRPSCCPASGCTNVSGLRYMDRLINFTDKLSCSVRFTGGTEPHPASGQCAHCRGYSADLSGTCLSDFITQHYRRVGSGYLDDGTGNWFLDNYVDGHWHVQFYDTQNGRGRKGCDDSSGTTVELITSGDPNGKVGSEGWGEAHYLPAQRSLRYGILFENAANASAAAQQVVISDTLDGRFVDLQSLALGPILFGEHILTPPPLSTQYRGEVDLRPTQNLIARVEAALDAPTGVLTWRFSSIDPATGQPTEDPLAGFLPPDELQPEGQGSVYFHVPVKRGLQSGSQIQNQATIVFDQNAPIATQAWVNTIDSDNPASRVDALSPIQHTETFVVGWSGTDAASGIKSYTVYKSENGGPFQPFITDSVATSTKFIGERGHTYGFFSIAQDQAGNFEPQKSLPEATTRVRANRPPVANAGPDLTLECLGSHSAGTVLDGSGSTDPDGDPLTCSWSSATCAVEDPTACVTSTTCVVGENLVTLVVNDGTNDSSPDDARITVRDTLPPSGGITGPPVGSCHGPAALPVTVADNFADQCDRDLTRTYTPAGGPSYSAHGDYHVVLTAVDSSGNSASGVVDFTIDTVSPAVQLVSPLPGTIFRPSVLPFSIVFQSNNDDDGASGGAHEILKLQDRPGGRYCLIYDGATYGNRDGQLVDETVKITQAELCRLAALCGFTLLSQPEIRMEARDCGGNVGSVGLRFSGGSVSLRPGICGP